LFPAGLDDCEHRYNPETAPGLTNIRQRPGQKK